jgi:hypothetical protein
MEKKNALDLEARDESPEKNDRGDAARWLASDHLEG